MFGLLRPVVHLAELGNCHGVLVETALGVTLLISSALRRYQGRRALVAPHVSEHRRLKGGVVWIRGLDLHLSADISDRVAVAGVACLQR